jgi:hypothetical protein
MVVGVGFCKIKVDSNFLLVLKIKCTKFHQDRSKTVDLHTKYTNKQTFSLDYQCFHQAMIIPWKVLFFIIWSTSIFFCKISHQKTLESVTNVNIIDRFAQFF